MKSPSQSVSGAASVVEPASGQFDGARHVFPLRVYYEDTDLSGIVYHANYLRFMERGRSDLLRCLGIDQRAAVEAGEGSYAVADITLRFASPAKLDDALVVETRVQDLKAASVTLAQSVWRGEKLLATGTVRVAFVAPDGRPRRQPLAWREKFQTFFLTVSDILKENE